MDKFVNLNEWKSFGQMASCPRYRTSLLAPQIVTNGSWSNVILGGASALNVNEFEQTPKPINWNADKLEFFGEWTVNYLLSIDFLFTAPSDTLNLLGNLVCKEPDEIWLRFVAPEFEGVSAIFPLPDSEQATKLASFDRPDAKLGVNFSYAVYANQFLIDRGLEIQLQLAGSRTVTLADCVLLAFPL